LPAACLADPAPLYDVHVAQVLPKPDGHADYYPAAAAGKEINGAATIKCRIAANGRLTDCAVVSETPAGYDFGKGTIEMAQDRIVADTSQDKPGDWVLWTFHFTHD
jgi:protein TonB